MVRLLVIAGVLFLAYWATGIVVGQTGVPRVEGGTVHLDTDDLEVRFATLGPVSESYMLFGGNNEQPRNSLTHATMATLEISHARLIHERYPDFHMCKSPGAAKAKRLIETVSFLAAGRRARNALVEAVDLNEERVRSGGERTCLTVSGSELSLDAVRLKQNSEDITSELRPKLARTRMVLAESAEIVDCQPLLR